MQLRVRVWVRVEDEWERAPTSIATEAVKQTPTATLLQR